MSVLATVSVHDLLGREAFRADVKGDGLQREMGLPGPSLSAGQYLVRLAAGEGVFTRRLVVRR